MCFTTSNITILACISSTGCSRAPAEALDCWRIYHKNDDDDEDRWDEDSEPRVLGYCWTVPDAKDPTSVTISTWFISREVAADPVAQKCASESEGYMSSMLLGFRHFEVVRFKRTGRIRDARASMRADDEKLAMGLAVRAGLWRAEGARRRTPRPAGEGTTE